MRGARNGTTNTHTHIQSWVCVSGRCQFLSVQTKEKAEVQKPVCKSFTFYKQIKFKQNQVEGTKWPLGGIAMVTQSKVGDAVAA